MKQVWSEAFDALQDQFPSQRGSESVIRVELRKEGELIWHLLWDHEPKWWRWKRGRGRLLDPCEDSKLPMAHSHGAGALLAYRPNRRMVWRDSDGVSIGKAYRNKRHLPVLRKISRVETSLAEVPELCVPSVLREDSAHSAFWMETRAGTAPPIHVSAAPLWKKFGSAVSKFQSAVPTHGLPLHGPLDELNVLRRFQRKFESAVESLPTPWHATLARLEKAAPQLRPSTPVACHRDLHDQQILWDGSCFAWLDWDLLCAADPALDLGNLSAHFLLRTLQFGDPDPNATADLLARHLLEGMKLQDRQRFFRALRFYQITTLLRLYMLYRMRPRWRSLCSELLLHAEQALKELSCV